MTRADSSNTETGRIAGKDRAITPLYHLVPFLVAFASFVAARSSGVPDIAAPFIAGVASLSFSTLVCIALHETAALFAVSCGLANVAVAFFVFPWISGYGQSAIAAWVAASDLLVVALFGTDHLIALRRYGPAVRTMSSGVAFQTGLMLCVFLWPGTGTFIAVLCVYAVYTVASWFGVRRVRGTGVQGGG